MKACLVGGSLEYPDWEHDHLQSRKLQPPLQRVGGLIVQEAIEPALPLENQLPGEEDGARKLARDLTRHAHGLGNHFRTHYESVDCLLADLLRLLTLILETLLLCLSDAVHLLDALERSAVDNTHAHKENVAEMIREELEHGEQGMDSQTGIPADEQHSSRLFRVEGLGRNGRRRQRLEDLVEPLEPGEDPEVVPLDRDAQRDERARCYHRQPSAFAKLLRYGDDENRHAQRATDEVDPDTALPVRMPRASFPLQPVADHAHLGQRERKEHVDRVHDHESVHSAACIEQHQQTGAAHEHDAILHRESLTQRAEAVGEP